MCVLSLTFELEVTHLFFHCIRVSLGCGSRRRTRRESAKDIPVDVKLCN